MEKDPMLETYYSCDLAISITSIKAKNKHHAEAAMQTFIDEIGKIMVDEVSWDDAQWDVITNTYVPEYESWVEE